MIFCDAHLHIIQCIRAGSITREAFIDIFNKNCDNKFFLCTCSHDRLEFEAQDSLVRDIHSHHIKSAFGLHPQNPNTDNADYLESLLKSHRIQAIGECGFDFFTADFKNQRLKQEEAWSISLELAQKYSVPIIVHNRKALDLMFRDYAKLKKIPAIIFHSFAFSPREAFSLINHGANVYFSFGKPLLNGNKKSRSCVASLPTDRLLLETDAPFQTLKGEHFTSPSDICLVYKEAALLRNMNMEELAQKIEMSFKNIFGTF